MRPILTMGSFGQEVRQVQGLLNTMLHSKPKLAVNGFYSDREMLKVKEFQFKYQIPVSGVVEDLTWQALLGKEAAEKEEDPNALSPRREEVLRRILPKVVPSEWPHAKFKLLVGKTDPNDPSLGPTYTTCGTLPAFVAAHLGGSGLITYGGLNSLRDAARKGGAWVSNGFDNVLAKEVLGKSRRPKPGDLYALSYGRTPDALIVHVGVIVRSEGSIWTTADAGQGIKSQGEHKCKEVQRNFDEGAQTLTGEILYGQKPRFLNGWLDIDAYPFPR